MRLKRRGALSSLALFGALALLVGASATAQTVRLGNLIVTIEGQISPRKLPRKEPAPITLTVSGSLKTADATHPPALKSLFLEFDKHGHLQGWPVAKHNHRQGEEDL
jgi:hypothetical protein